MQRSNEEHELMDGIFTSQSRHAASRDVLRARPRAWLALVRFCERQYSSIVVCIVRKAVLLVIVFFTTVFNSLTMET